MRIGYAISTCIEYAPRTLGPCLDSLLKSGIPKEDILVFGLDGRHKGMEELRAAVCIPEQPCIYPFDAYFLLHCTCIAGPNFRGCADSMFDTMVALGSDLMGLRPDIMVAHIGMVRPEFLRVNREQLTLYSDCNKRQKLEKEIHGWIVKMARNYGCFSTSEEWSEVSVYGVQRAQRYFRELDLYKFTKPLGPPHEIPESMKEGVL